MPRLLSWYAQIGGNVIISIEISAEIRLQDSKYKLINFIVKWVPVPIPPLSDNTGRQYKRIMESMIVDQKEIAVRNELGEEETIGHNPCHTKYHFDLVDHNDSIIDTSVHSLLVE